MNKEELEKKIQDLKDIIDKMSDYDGSLSFYQYQLYELEKEYNEKFNNNTNSGTR